MGYNSSMERDANARLLLLLIAGAGLVTLASIVAALAWPDGVVCEINGGAGGCADDGSAAVVYVSGFVGAVGACLLVVSLVGYGVKFGQQAADSDRE
jgi:hypothetical protein